MPAIEQLVRELVSAGMEPGDAGALVARAIAEAIQSDHPAISPGAARQRRWRDRKASQSVSKASQSVSKRLKTSQSVSRDAKKEAPLSSSPPAPSSPLYNPPSTPPTSPPKTPQKENARASFGAFRDAFDAFWWKFPNKVGKQAASKAFDKAIKVVSVDRLMASLQAYVHKTDDRPWCNPATWLNQHRWEDVPAARGPSRLTGYHAVYEQLTNGGNHGEGSGDDGLYDPARTIDHEPDLLGPLGAAPKRD